MKFEPGDMVVIKPLPPTVAEVLEVFDNGQLLVRWPSGKVSRALKSEDYVLYTEPYRD